MQNWIETLHSICYLSAKGINNVAKNASEEYLHPTQHYLLGTIYFFNGDCLYTDVLRHVPFSPGTVSRQLHELEKKGFILRSKDEEQRHRKRVTMTERGSAYAAKTLAFLSRHEEKNCSDMTDKDRAHLMHCLQVISDNLTEGPHEDPLPENWPMLCHYFINLHRLINAKISDVCHEFNFSTHEHKVLLCLHYSGQWKSFKYVEHSTVVSQPEVVRSIFSLQKAGYLECRPSETDARVKLAHLTPQGINFAEAILKAHEPWMKAARKGLTARDRARLLQLLQRWEKNRDENDQKA